MYARHIPAWLKGLGVAALLVGLAGPSHADDQPFTTIYTTDIQSEGGRELEQTLVWKTNEADVRFNDLQERTEIEYGIKDYLQGSLYLNYDFEQSREHDPFGPVETANAFGTSGELILRLLNPYFDPIGFAVYFEPAWSAKEHSIETKVLLQKNFFNDTLRTVLNINFEDTWSKVRHGPYEKASALEINLGAMYNVTPDFSVGLEMDNEHGFDGEILGGSASEASNSFFLGPTIQYIGHPWAIVAGFQTQLPIATNPTGAPGAVEHGMTAGAEHFRATVRFTTDF
jgi:hypothetical protein